MSRAGTALGREVGAGVGAAGPAGGGTGQGEDLAQHRRRGVEQGAGDAACAVGGRRRGSDGAVGRALLATQLGRAGDILTLAEAHFEGRFQGTDLGQAGRGLGPRLVVGVEGHGNGHQQADDGNHDHQFDQCNTALHPHGRFPYLKSANPQIISLGQAGKRASRPEPTPFVTSLNRAARRGSSTLVRAG